MEELARKHWQITFLLSLFSVSLSLPTPSPHPPSCAYVLVCELDENRLLAESVLSLLARLIHDHVTTMEQKNAEVSITQLVTITIATTQALPTDALSALLMHLLQFFVTSLPPSLPSRLPSRLRRQLPSSTSSFQTDSSSS